MDDIDKAEGGLVRERLAVHSRENRQTTLRTFGTLILLSTNTYREVLERETFLGWRLERKPYQSELIITERKLNATYHSTKQITVLSYPQD